MRKKGFKIFYLLLLCQSFLFVASHAQGDYQFKIPRLSADYLNKIESSKGLAARNRLLAWQSLIRENKDLPERKKLTKVNNFFNKLLFRPDDASPARMDYWMTPFEFLIANGGDCEDFSIAKYFTLIAMGVPESKLRVAYVKAVRYQRAHMVLTYYESIQAEPLILDNLVEDIRRASQRPDLLPVYSFNAGGLWIARQRGRGKSPRRQRVGEPRQLGRWQKVLHRMQQHEDESRIDINAMEKDEK